MVEFNIIGFLIGLTIPWIIVVVASKLTMARENKMSTLMINAEYAAFRFTTDSSGYLTSEKVDIDQDVLIAWVDKFGGFAGYDSIGGYSYRTIEGTLMYKQVYLISNIKHIYNNYYLNTRLDRVVKFENNSLDVLSEDETNLIMMIHG